MEQDTPELLIGALALDRLCEALGLDWSAFPQGTVEAVATAIGDDAVKLLVEVAERTGNAAARDFLRDRAWDGLWRTS